MLFGVIDIRTRFVAEEQEATRVRATRNTSALTNTEIETLINKIEGVRESFVFGKPENNNENDLKIISKIVYDKEFFKETHLEFRWDGVYMGGKPFRSKDNSNNEK